MAELNGLPIYYIKINEDLSHNTGIDFISLVDCPAIEKNWVAMSDTKKPLKFSTDPDKQLLAGPILIPDQPIYRNDNGLEYWVIFKAEEIQKLVRKFQASKKTINLNYQHKKDSQIALAVVQEIWLTGKSDKSKDFGFDLPVNSAFVVTHIGDTKFWTDEVKTGNVKGFSIEGFLDMEMKRHNREKFTEVKVKNDNSLYVDGEVKVGSFVYYNVPQIVLINGAKSEIKNLVWESNVTLEDGTVLVIANGKIIEIPNQKAMSKVKLEASAKTNDGKNLKTPADAMTEGVELMIVAEDGTESVAPDGDYVLESGETVTVLAGKITAIAEVELNQEEKDLIQEAMSSVIKPIMDKLAAMELKNAEIETKLSKIPGAPSSTSSTDDNKPVKLSAIQSVKTKLSILRKKESELNK